MNRIISVAKIVGSGSENVWELVNLHFNTLSLILQKNVLFSYLFGKYLCPLNKSEIFLKSMIFVEVFHDFGWVFATRIRIQTDPDPKHC